MPLSTPGMSARRPEVVLSRRALLGGLGGVLAYGSLVSCSGTGGDPGPEPSAGAPPDPAYGQALAALLPVMARAEELHGRYPEAAAFAEEAERLTAYRTLLTAASAATQPTRTPSSSSTSNAAGAAADEAEGRRTLVADERGLSERLRSLAAGAGSGEAAWVLGSMAAGLAQAAGSQPRPVAAIEEQPVKLSEAAASAAETLLGRLHEAVWGVGLLGARTSISANPDLFAAVTGLYDAVRAERDALLTALAAAGQDPVAASPSYPRWRSVKPTVAGISAAAATLERDLTSAHAWVVYNALGSVRVWSLDGMTRNAVRGLTFQGVPEKFPGASELADRVRTAATPTP